jgi:antitoxin (DNA-binding transcriptional repressor) of toxin-antitoxin stability system
MTFSIESLTTRQNLDELLNEMARNGEIVLTRGGQDVAKIVPLVGLTQKKRQFGSAKGFVSVPEDFDAPMDDFGEDV